MRSRVRQLKNGKWVGEIRKWWWLGWVGVDARNPNFDWPPGHHFYRECWNETEADAENALFNYLAGRGQ